jgi:hypothetical protein
MNRTKLYLLGGTSLLALVAAATDAGATPVMFNYTGTVEQFIVPSTGSYQILAFGAQGGGAGNFDGGLGAEIRGDFQLTAGAVLHIAVGGAGGSAGYSGGGGGGSFVVGPGSTPLVVAGGGGGAGGPTPPYPGATTVTVAKRALRAATVAVR